MGQGHVHLVVNVGIKLLEFHQLSWRERFSSFVFSSQFLGTGQGRAVSDQQSNCPKINSLMSRFTAKETKAMCWYEATERQKKQEPSMKTSDNGRLVRQVKEYLIVWRGCGDGRLWFSHFLYCIYFFG